MPRHISPNETLTSTRLPVELLEEIFRFAATPENSDLARTAVNLMQVSTRVYYLVQPILYETIVIINNGIHRKFYPPTVENYIGLNPSDFLTRFGSYIRHLYLDPLNGAQDIVKALSLCPSLKNLVIVEPCSLQILEAIQRGPCLQRLTGKFEECSVSLDPSNQACRHLTHLDLVGSYLWDDVSDFLTRLPNLTHLALDDTGYDDDMVVRALKNCPKLRCLLLVSEYKNSAKARTMGSSYCEAQETEWYDERVVVVRVAPLESWLDGLRLGGGLDMWRLADEVVTERRKRRGSGNKGIKEV